MVVADLRVVDDAPERQQVQAGDVGRGLRVGVVAPDALGRRLDVGDHVRRQVARARARIGERLVLLVEALRSRERAARREAVARVGVALQRREVVEHRRALGAPRLVQLGDLAALAANGLDDRLRLLGRLDPRLRAGVEAALVTPLVVGRELRVDQPVLLGDERADLLLAPRQDRQRRRLHAAQRDRAVEARAQPDRRRARRVHADQPVGLRARPRRLLERRELAAVAQVGEALAHRVVGHRREPEALDRQLGAGLLVEVGEDQLALAPGVARVDDRARCRRASCSCLTTLICFCERSSRTTSLNLDGTIGRSAIRHFLNLSS